MARATADRRSARRAGRSEEHTSDLQSRSDLVCRLLLEKKNKHVHHVLADQDHVLPAWDLLPDGALRIKLVARLVDVREPHGVAYDFRGQVGRPPSVDPP